MAFSIFKLVGSIFVDNEEANKSIAKTDKKAEGLGKRFLKGAKTVGKWGAAIGGAAIAGATAIASVALKGADATDRIDKMSQSLGFSRKGFQEWDYVLSQNGASIDSLKAGMKTLTNQTDDLKNGVKLAKDNFGALGISADDLKGKTQEDIFALTIERLQGVEDKTKRAAIANDLLGRSGADLAPLLNQSAEATENLKNKTEELGLIIEDETIDAGVALTDTFDTFKRELSAVLLPVIKATMPFVTKLLDLIMDNMPLITSMLDTLFEFVMPVLDELLQTIFPVLTEFLEIFMNDLFPPLMALLMVLLTDLLLPLIEQLSGPLFEILVMLADILVALMPALVPLIDLLVMLLDLVLPPLIKIIEVLSKILSGTLGKAFEFIGKMISGVVDKFKGLLNFVKNMKIPLNEIIKSINKVISGLNKIALPDWVPAIGGKGINIPLIPKLAKGGTILDDGMAMVGEMGPELVTLPKGATVHTNDDSKKMMGGVTQNIYFTTKEQSVYETERYQEIASQQLARSMG